MKRIQATKQKMGTYEIDKVSLSCFDIKDLFYMMEFTRWLIFIKIVERLKKIVIKKIVMIEKYCGNKNVL